MSVIPYKKDWTDYCPYSQNPRKLIIHYINELPLAITRKVSFDCSDKESCPFSEECPIFKTSPNY